MSQSTPTLSLYSQSSLLSVTEEQKKAIWLGCCSDGHACSEKSSLCSGISPDVQAIVDALFRNEAAKIQLEEKGLGGKTVSLLVAADHFTVCYEQTEVRFSLEQLACQHILAVANHVFSRSTSAPLAHNLSTQFPLSLAPASPFAQALNEERAAQELITKTPSTAASILPVQKSESDSSLGALAHKTAQQAEEEFRRAAKQLSQNIKQLSKTAARPTPLAKATPLEKTPLPTLQLQPVTEIPPSITQSASKEIASTAAQAGKKAPQGSGHIVQIGSLKDGGISPFQAKQPPHPLTFAQPKPQTLGLSREAIEASVQKWEQMHATTKQGLLSADTEAITKAVSSYTEKHLPFSSQPLSSGSGVLDYFKSGTNRKNLTRLEGAGSKRLPLSSGQKAAQLALKTTRFLRK